MIGDLSRYSFDKLKQRVGMICLHLVIFALLYLGDYKGLSKIVCLFIFPNMNEICLPKIFFNKLDIINKMGFRKIIILVIFDLPVLIMIIALNIALPLNSRLPRMPRSLPRSCSRPCSLRTGILMIRTVYLML